MKNTKWFLILSILFTYLYYEEGAGINVLLFTLVLLSALYIQHGKELKKPVPLFFSLGALISAVMVSLLGYQISILSNVVSLLILSLSIYLNKSSVLGLLAQSAFAYVCTPWYRLKEYKQHEESKNENKENQKSLNKWFIGILSILVFALFVSFYRFSSAGFNHFVLKLNFDFISFSLIAFFLFGILLTSTFMRPVYHQGLANLEQNSNLILAFREFKEYQILGTWINKQTENALAVILLSGLNLLLLLVNLLDTEFLFSGNLPEGSTYSEYLHQGIFSLILSILSAMAILLWLFRGSRNFSENKMIRTLAIIWIILNVWLTLSSAYRNQLYIEEFALTYKRIGVFVFLICALGGFVLTFIKIQNKKTGYFLIRYNSLLWYIILVCSTGMNWDRNIAEFNIAQARHKNQYPDIPYLSSLSYQAYPATIEYLVEHPLKDSSNQEINESGFIDDSSEKMMRRIVQNEDHYTWKSFNYMRCKGYREIHSYVKNMKSHSAYPKSKIRLEIYQEYRNPFGF